MSEKIKFFTAKQTQKRRSEQQGYHIGLQQATMYHKDNGISCDEQINNIDPDQVKSTATNGTTKGKEKCLKQ